MIDIAVDELGLFYDDQLSDALSSKLHTGLVNFVSALGEILGPVLGGLIVQAYSYKAACGIVSALSFAVFLVFCRLSYRQKQGHLPHADTTGVLELQTALEAERTADSPETQPLLLDKGYNKESTSQ
jgi:MFS family permease